MNTLVYGYYPSRWGTVIAVKSHSGLRSLTLATYSTAVLDALVRDDEVIAALIQGFDTPHFVYRGALDLAGTAFQRKVWQTLLSIPYGETVCYEEIAQRVGTRAVRAVGTAIKHNPVAFILPCHRVVRKSGALGNYFYGTALKQAILSFEQAAIE